mgnify:CR=1 FL=1
MSILGLISFLNCFIKAFVNVSSSLPLSPLSITNLWKLNNIMLHLSPNAPPNAVFPAHFGPIMKKTYGSIAAFVISNTSLTDPKASIHLPFPNCLYKSITGIDYLLNAYSLFTKVSGLSSALPLLLALARHRSINTCSLTL